MQKKKEKRQVSLRLEYYSSAIYLAFTAGNVFWGMFKYGAALVNIHGGCPYQQDKITLRNI